MNNSETEYIAISELVKKVKFVKQLIKNFGIQTDLSILLIMDNMGAIHIPRNNTSGTETKYVNIRFHYIRDLYNNQIVVLQFVKYDNNESNIITKHLTQKEFERHSSKLVGLVPVELLALIKKQKGC